MAEPASPFARDTAQTRSEATTRRLVEVGHELFVAGTLATTPVAEIARAAEISVGGFYGRFRTKADLERAVAESMMRRLSATFDELLAAEALPDELDAGQVVHRFALGLVRIFGGPEREAIGRLGLMVRGDADLPESRVVRESNARTHALFAEALLARRDDIGHPDPTSAIAFTDLAMSAAAREALLHAGTGLRPDNATLVDQLTDLGCSYLRIPRPQDSTER